MGAHSIAQRTSCLIERGQACADGFEQIGLAFSAEMTRDIVSHLEAGAPAPLYDHWIGEQEARLVSKRNAMVRQWAGEND